MNEYAIPEEKKIPLILDKASRQTKNKENNDVCGL